MEMLLRLLRLVTPTFPSHKTPQSELDARSHVQFPKAPSYLIKHEEQNMVAMLLMSWTQGLTPHQNLGEDLF